MHGRITGVGVERKGVNDLLEAFNLMGWDELVGWGHHVVFVECDMGCPGGTSVKCVENGGGIFDLTWHG